MRYFSPAPMASVTKKAGHWLQLILFVVLVIGCGQRSQKPPQSVPPVNSTEAGSADCIQTGKCTTTTPTATVLILPTTNDEQVPPQPRTTSTLTPEPEITALPSPTPIKFIETKEPTQVTPTPIVTPTISAAVAAYLEEAYQVMHQNSLFREEIDWEAFQDRYQAQIQKQQPQNIEEAQFIIQQALFWLGDQHSQFMTSGEMEAWRSGRNQLIKKSLFNAELLPGNIAYFHVPAFSTGSETALNHYATLLQEVVSELDAASPCGWIVDLRLNSGGNMWPMIVGVGPLLGEGQVGGNRRADETLIPWRYTGGQAWWGEELLAQSTNPAVVLRETFPPTAVLIDTSTASAGEAVAISFQQRPNTRFFGHATAGFTTANEPYFLSDGAVIFLSDSLMADRNGAVYADGVMPDDVVALNGSYEAPLSWLTSQPACGNTSLEN